MDPVTGAMIAAGGSSLLGGLLGFAGQSSANATNLALAREQMQWQENMWDKQNAYNTPAAQVERLRAAGLNPAMMYSQGNVGNAGSVGSYSRAQVDNVMAPLGQGIASAGMGIADLMIKNEQVKQMQANTRLLQARANQVVNQTPTADAWRDWFNARYHNLLSDTSYKQEKATTSQLFNLDYNVRLSQQKRLNDLNINHMSYQLQKDAEEIALLGLKKTYTQEVINKTRADIDYLNLRYRLLDQLGPQQYEHLVRSIAKINQDIGNSNREQDRRDKALKINTLLKAAGISAGFAAKLIPLL